MIDNTHINHTKSLISPTVLIEECPATSKITQTVMQARQTIRQILNGTDDRLLVIAGPCSIHDPEAAIDYARRLQAYVDDFANELVIVMRIYFEKPRTTGGWKGLINDPDLDGRFNINRGLRTARQLLLTINDLGLPAGSEFLDTIVPQYITDLVGWGAIGARTTESQVHRELASGLPMPIGFKNGTSGDIQIAINAINVTQQPHHFLSINHDGIGAIISTQGNPDSHIILRGGQDGPNYEASFITDIKSRLHQANLITKIMVDCSHDNSFKDHRHQSDVVTNICHQIALGETSLFGVMLESHLVAGSQPLTNVNALTYGQSITDACVDFGETIQMLQKLAQAVKKRRQAHQAM